MKIYFKYFMLRFKTLNESVDKLFFSASFYFCQYNHSAEELSISFQLGYSHLISTYINQSD